MDRISPIALIATLVLVALPAPNAARAEGFVDLRVGGSFTEDGDVELTVRAASISSSPPSTRIPSPEAFAAGYWFDSLPWLGLAADVSYFAPDDDTFGGPEIDVIPISPLLMLRAPLVTRRGVPARPRPAVHRASGPASSSRSSTSTRRRR